MLLPTSPSEPDPTQSPESRTRPLCCYFLFSAVCRHNPQEWLKLVPDRESGVAKRADSRYLPGQRGWIKVKKQRTASPSSSGSSAMSHSPRWSSGCATPIRSYHHFGVARLAAAPTTNPSRQRRGRSGLASALVRIPQHVVVAIKPVTAGAGYPLGTPGASRLTKTHALSNGGLAATFRWVRSALASWRRH